MCFKLARVSECAITEQLFIKPKKYTAEQKIGKAWSLIPEGTVYRIELEFTKMVADECCGGALACIAGA